MFTGLVLGTGTLARSELRGGDRRIWIEHPGVDLGPVQLGDSIAVSGVCLTVVECGPAWFAADLSAETLARTTLGCLELGAAVNLEPSLRLGDRLGGHLVSGHVDGIGRVLSITPDGRAERWRFALPPPLARYVAVKGSIAVDGVSLTVNAVDANAFEVALIPHTVAVTSFRLRRAGSMVNLEVDLVARYLDRLLEARAG